MIDPLKVHVMTGKLLQHVGSMPESMEVKILALRAAAEMLAQIQTANLQLQLIENAKKR